MKELIIHDNEAGQRLDKLLRKYLSEAPGSFIYKMLRKKNIVLNGKKATGNEHLKKGDSVKLFLADDTIAKFQAAGKTVEESIKNTVKLDVIYEDQNVIFINKTSVAEGEGNRCIGSGECDSISSGIRAAHQRES